MHATQLIRRISFTAVFLGISSSVFASDFNVPFINAAGLGTLYSDWASGAHDASTAYTNPAGLTQLPHTEWVFSFLGLAGSTQFSGTTTPPFAPSAPQDGTASSQLRGIFPSIYFSSPLASNNRVTFGVSETIPFALGTNYDKDSIVRYAGTRSQIVVMDTGPSFGFKVNDKLSLGLGLDFNRMTFMLNSMYGTPLSVPDSESQNHLEGWGMGWHGGVLYKVSPTTRTGLSFNSMVVMHTTGDSEVFLANGNEVRTTDQESNAALPARTQLSLEHDLNSRWTVMGTLFYTNWRSLDKITLQHSMLPSGQTTPVTILLNYHNTFDYSVGVNFKATEKWLLRTGVQLLSTPSNNHDRSITDPVASATILGIGAHYQQNKQLGYDFGYAHAFFRQAAVNLATALTTASGHTNTNSNVLGAQVTWDVA